MIVKLRRAGPEGATWMLTLTAGGQPEWLESSDALEGLIPSGSAWVEAEFHDAKWLVRRVVATAVPAAEAKAFQRSEPRQRQLKVVASA